MEKIRIVTFIALLILVSPFVMKSTNNGTTIEVVLVRTTAEEVDKSNNENIRSPHRMPYAFSNMSLSILFGVCIDGVDNTDILSYNVYSIEAGSLLGTYVDETEFVNYIFSISHPIEIRVNTPQYIYTGYIEP